MDPHSDCHAEFVLTTPPSVEVRNCHTVDTHEMKWSIGRGDAFVYKVHYVDVARMAGFCPGAYPLVTVYMR